jgi:hypothetical protein
MADGAQAASGVNGEQLQGLRSRTGLVQDEHAWAEVMSA